MPTRPTAGLLGAIDRRPSVRLAAMLLIGIGIAMLAHWSVQILAPTMEEPAVVSSSERVGEYCRRAASCSPTFETRAVTAGATVTIPKSIPTGRPIRIVRSVSR